MEENGWIEESKFGERGRMFICFTHSLVLSFAFCCPPPSSVAVMVSRKYTYMQHGVRPHSTLCGVEYASLGGVWSAGAASDIHRRPISRRVRRLTCQASSKHFVHPGNCSASTNQRDHILLTLCRTASYCSCPLHPADQRKSPTSTSPTVFVASCLLRLSECPMHVMLCGSQGSLTDLYSYSPSPYSEVTTHTAVYQRLHFVDRHE